MVGGGYAATASLIGAPDIGQLGLAEMADHYRRLANSVEVPILADADTGFGDSVNVARTVRTYERAGVAALIIEDQVAPKRCGHMEGKRVISVADMIAKIKAALDARVDGDLMIVARTDARAIEGLEAAVERAQLYRAVGADMIFVEAPLSTDEMAYICSAIAAPCLANNVEGGKTPILSAERLEEIGYAAVAFPVSASYVAAKALRGFLRRPARRRRHQHPHRPHAALRRLPRDRRPAQAARAGACVRCLRPRIAGTRGGAGSRGVMRCVWTASAPIRDAPPWRWRLALSLAPSASPSWFSCWRRLPPVL